MKKSFYKATLLMLLSTFSLLSFKSSEEIIIQSIERHVILFKIKGELTVDQAEEIDAIMNTKDGVLASRTDPYGSIYFSYTLKSKNLTETNFRKWFREMGYEIACFDKIVEGEGVSKTFEEIVNCQQ